MAYVIGVLLALAVSAFATVVGFDRERTFYPTLTIVIASYYGLFAILGGSLEALASESVVIAGYVVIAALGFKLNLWLLVAALFGHGVFDFVHGQLLSNPGVPDWWPMFCMTYDITAAGYLAWRLSRSGIAAKAPSPAPGPGEGCTIASAPDRDDALRRKDVRRGKNDGD